MPAIVERLPALLPSAGISPLLLPPLSAPQRRLVRVCAFGHAFALPALRNYLFASYAFATIPSFQTVAPHWISVRWSLVWTG
jgi:hypothetical protein